MANHVVGASLASEAPGRFRRLAVTPYTVFIYTVPFLAVLTGIVFFHEMGHFLMGRLFGVKIDAFSLGFGPELAHYVDRRGTRWRLALLPLGGYVKFHGDGDPASMTHADTGVLAPEAMARTLQAQAVWKRALVVAAGPAVNFILAIVLFAGLYALSGRTVIRPELGAVRAGSAAEAAGFKAGDVVTAVNGSTIDSFEDMQRAVQGGDGTPLFFTLQRDGNVLTLPVTPRRTTLQTVFGPLTTNVLGVESSANKNNVRLVRAGPLEAVSLGARETWYIVESTANYVKRLFAGRESTDQLSGPIRIAQVSGQVARMGIGPLINLAAILSVSIGLLNLLPIPLLDGGFLLFFAFEAIRGRALKERTMEVGFRIGLTFVAALSIFVAFNDISRIFSAKPAPQTTVAAPKR